MQYCNTYKSIFISHICKVNTSNIQYICIRCGYMRSPYGYYIIKHRKMYYTFCFACATLVVFFFLFFILQPKRNNRLFAKMMRITNSYTQKKLLQFFLFTYFSVFFSLTHMIYSINISVLSLPS